MNRTIKMALVAGLSLAGLSFAAESTSAAPMTGLDNTVAHQSDLQKGVQNARYVCGPWGCRWAPYPYWGYGYGYGYYRPYWHPWGWGWGRRW